MIPTNPPIHIHFGCARAAPGSGIGTRNAISAGRMQIRLTISEAIAAQSG